MLPVAKAATLVLDASMAVPSLCEWALVKQSMTLTYNIETNGENDQLKATEHISDFCSSRLEQPN
jgi:hypothetical protein